MTLTHAHRTGAKRLKKLVLIAIASLLLAGCFEKEADIASKNLSTAADQFEVQRRVVFFNGITDTYLLSIEGLCSLGNNDDPGELSVTCKVGPGTYKKHFLGLSDNVSYFVEQLEPVAVDVYHYRVVFRPSTLIPDIEVG
jgi:hypothetical protein